MSDSETAGEVQVAEAPEIKPTSTYRWLSSLPIASSAGSTVYSLYETSKNCCHLSHFALGTVECSVKYAAGAAAPFVKRLDGPSECPPPWFISTALFLHTVSARLAYLIPSPNSRQR